MSTRIGRAILELLIDQNGLAQGFSGVNRNIEGFKSSLGAASAGFKDFGRQMTATGGQLTAALTLPLAGLGAAAVAAGMDFEKAMNSIKGVLTPTSGEMEQFRSLALKMGADTVFSATDAATAMLELGKAGFTSKESMAAVDEVLQLAAASGLSMGEAAELAARTTAAFGLQVEDLSHVNDVLAKAVNSSTLEIGDLQTAFKYVGPIAQGFGISIEQTTAALATMRDQGIAAETSGRALREGMSRMANPVKAVHEVLGELGISLAQVNPATHTLGEIVGVLQEKGLTAAQALRLFGDAAGPGMFALVQKGQPALDSLAESLKNSDGAAKAMADAMMTGLPGAFEKMKGSVDTALISLSKALEPTLIKVLGLIGQLADFLTTTVIPAFQALPEPVQGVIIGVAAFAAALGPVLVAIGAVSSAIGVAIPLFTTMLPAAFTAVLPFLGPIGLIAAGVAAVVAAWAYWDEIVAFFKGGWQIVVQSMQAVPGWLLPALGPIGLVVATFRYWDEIVVIVAKVFTAVKTWLVDKFVAIVQGVKDKIQAVTGFFSDMYEKVVGHSYVPDMIDGIASEFGRLGDVMVAPVEAATGRVSGLFASLAENISSAFGGALSSLGRGDVKGAANDYGEFVTRNILGMVPVVGPLLQQFAGPAWSGLKKIGSAIGGLFGGKSDMNKHRDAALKDFAGTGDLAAASDKVRELGFAAGVSDTEMRSLFSVSRVEDFNRIFTSITDQIAEFNRKTAESLQVMKDELSTPVVVPITFGMINPGLGGGSGTDMFSPRNFASYADWSQNWLGRNQNDVHRLGEALGGENPWGVPMLDQGGIVTRPTLAVVGERRPEAIIPLEEMGRAGGNNSGLLRDILDTLRASRRDSKQLPTLVAAAAMARS